MLVKLRLLLASQLQIRHHSLHFGGELCTALLLQLREHDALVVVRGALVMQQPPRQLLAVKFRKQVLVAHVREQLHRLLEALLNELVAQLLAAGTCGGRRRRTALLQQRVAESCKQLGAARSGDSLVDERFKRLLQALVKQAGVLEALLHVRVELVVEHDDVLDKLQILALAARRRRGCGRSGGAARSCTIAARACRGTLG
mmetsp:Transcript_11008/g.29312  ORF Transcript_11008/g.29312 Transcript_11008/m.29312 type:complete len:201 (+) Transcript_11008:1036-1638(+)